MEFRVKATKFEQNHYVIMLHSRLCCYGLSAAVGPFKGDNFVLLCLSCNLLRSAL